MLRTPRCSGGLTRSIAALAVALVFLAGATSCSRSPTSAVAPARSGAGVSSSEVYVPIGDPLSTEIVVTLAPEVDVESFAAEYGARVARSNARAHAALLVPGESQTVLGLEQALSLDSRVITVDPNEWLETAESRQQSFAFDDGLGSAEAVAEQPAAGAIHLADAHAVASGQGVTVAILDTGIDPQHPQLQGVYAGGVDLVDHDDDPSEAADGVDEDGDGQVDEAFGHGTHVAGIVHLVAPQARLLAVRVLDADGRGSLLDVLEGVLWAVDHGAKVINMSLGSLRNSSALQLALRDAKALGVVVITSAGNWGDNDPVEFPARSPHVAAIAAVDAEARAADFSSYGQMVALAAPGVSVRSTYPAGGYRLWSGTSMSAPFVAGTCALLAELHPSWTLDEMLGRIGGAARPLADGRNGFGAGALDSGAALAPDWQPPPPPGDLPPEDMQQH